MFTVRKLLTRNDGPVTDVFKLLSQKRNIFNAQDEGQEKLNQIITETLRTVEKDNTLLITGINYSVGAKAGDNYLSNLLRVTVDGVKENNDSYLKSIIVKRALGQEQHSAFFNYYHLWGNEINVYKEIIPMLEKACGKKLNHPKFYYGDDKYIILEDLMPLHFISLDRRGGLDFDHAKAALEAIADFHSGSMIIKQSDAKGFSYIKGMIGNHPYQGDKSIIAAVPLMHNAIDTAVKRLQDHSKYTTFVNYLAQVKEIIPNILKAIIQDKPSIYTTVAHGDFYMNNFLFSYWPDKSLNQVMLIDYQGTRIMNSLIDLHHMIYTSVQPEVRREHLGMLLKYYHDRLTDNLKKSQVFKDDYLDKALSFESFKKAFDYNHVLGLLSALTILPAMTYNPKNIPDTKKVTKSWQESSDVHNMEQFYTDELTERLKDLADEFIAKDWCKLKP